MIYSGTNVLYKLSSEEFVMACVCTDTDACSGICEYYSKLPGDGWKFISVSSVTEEELVVFSKEEINIVIITPSTKELTPQKIKAGLEIGMEMAEMNKKHFYMEAIDKIVPYLKIVEPNLKVEEPNFRDLLDGLKTKPMIG